MMRSALRKSLATPVVAFGVATLLVGLLAMSASRAAFASTTDNRASVVGAGTVDLVGEGPGPALFNASALIPNQTVVNCLVIHHDNPGAVRLYSGGFTDSGNLADYVNLTIEEGTGGSSGNCAGFVAQNTIVVGTLTDFNTNHTNYATGAGFSSVATSPSMTYRITLTLDAATPNAQQGETLTALSFIWETLDG